MIISYDCRFYRGDLPCCYRRVCEGCPHYTPTSTVSLVEAPGSNSPKEILKGFEEAQRQHPQSLIHVYCDSGPIDVLHGVKGLDLIICSDLKGRLFRSAIAYDHIIRVDQGYEEKTHRPIEKGSLPPKNVARGKKKILIIKFAAIGDVLRTTSLLPELSKKYPDAEVHWICENPSLCVLAGNPLIKKTHVLSEESCDEVLNEHYDILINFDKDKGALGLAMLVGADIKYGFGMTRSGGVSPLNKESLYSVRTGIDDDLKFKTNRKTYPQIISEMACVAYKRGPYKLAISLSQETVARQWIEKTKSQDKIRIGLNTGCGSVFPLKKWPEERFVELAKKLQKDPRYAVFLLGGPEERERNARIKESFPRMFNTGTNNSLKDFIGIVSAMQLVVTSDTAAMHFAVGLGKHVVALMGPTSRTEIDLYDKGEIIRSDVDCSLCTHYVCHERPSCMQTISSEKVHDAVLKWTANVK